MPDLRIPVPINPVSRTAVMSPDPASPRLDVLILARDEAEVLPVSLASVLPQLGVDDHLTVVADHCRDATANVAQSMGAVALRRASGKPGKGFALRWWLEQTDSRGKPEDVIVILDADSQARPGFLAEVRTAQAQAHPALQARLEQAAPLDSPLAFLAGLSEFVDQRVYDRARQWLGWPVRLRGTGMVLRRWVLERTAPDLGSAVEDAELTLLVAAAGVPISLDLRAAVADVKPVTRQAAINQRARWLKGQLQLIRLHPGALASLLLRGPAGWSLLSAVVLKPRTLIMSAKALGLAALLAFGPHSWSTRAAEVLLGCTLALELLVWVTGLWLVRRQIALRKVIAEIPAFGLVWLRSVWRAVRSRDPWLRARPRAYDSPVGTTGPAPL